jgi:nucleotide-binding universal stress UspA family protein
VSKIIVGIDGSERSADALAFASTLARSAHAELLLAAAYPYDDAAAHVDTERRQALRSEAQEMLDRLLPMTGPGVPAATRTIADRSPGRALHTLAVRDRASLVVIGSSHRGALGRAFAGTTAERLLHGAPCPVAVVPRGSRGGELRTIAVGWDGGVEATAALTAATAVAGANGAELLIVDVLDDAWVVPPAHARWPGLVPDRRDTERQARERLEQLIAGLPERLDAVPVVLAGDPVEALAAQSEVADLLVLGSRGYGPHRAVLLGSVSGRVVRTAGCPVIVVPRGVSAPLEDLFRSVPHARVARTAT